MEPLRYHQSGVGVEEWVEPFRYQQLGVGVEEWVEPLRYHSMWLCVEGEQERVCHLRSGAQPLDYPQLGEPL